MAVSAVEFEREAAGLQRAELRRSPCCRRPLAVLTVEPGSGAGQRKCVAVCLSCGRKYVAPYV